MREFKSVVEKLAEMSPDDMAAHFHEHDVKGTRGASGMCAAANYIGRETGEPVKVSYKYITNETTGATVIAPPSVSLFAMRFDHGLYPGLVDGDADWINSSPLLLPKMEQ